MPTLEENLQAWNRTYDWSKEGEEWSAAWGGSESQWFGTIFPRVHAFLPTHTILEIAPGFGRWTNYLRAHAERLIIVDLSQACIDACQRRFGSDSKFTYHVNDGRSLEMIPDQSIDFVFSFDSLVHAEADVIRGYLAQIAKKLKPNGCGFVHHSNLGEYKWIHSAAQRIPNTLRQILMKINLLDQTHWRAVSMTADLFESYCRETGLACVSQELIHWGTRRLLIDCFSVFAPKASHWVRQNHVIRNQDFMRETVSIRHLSKLYARDASRGLR
jgi:2-polyprenyl-3-methyl-5-hydroxy-6-metoxy-1,4-benzoquinol methylase